MKTFKDSEGREWQVAIHVAAVKRVRDLLNLDLYKLIDDRFAGLAALLADPVQLVDVLYVLCRDECAKRSVSDEDFGRAMAGDVIDRATTAFLEAFTDFFPEPRVRAGIEKVLSKGRAVRSILMDRLETMLDRVDPASVATTLIASSGSSPASSDSTPGPSH